MSNADYGDLDTFTPTGWPSSLKDSKIQGRGEVRITTVKKQYGRKPETERKLFYIVEGENISHPGAPSGSKITIFMTELGGAYVGKDMGRFLTAAAGQVGIAVAEAGVLGALNGRRLIVETRNEAYGKGSKKVGQTFFGQFYEAVQDQESFRFPDVSASRPAPAAPPAPQAAPAPVAIPAAQVSDWGNLAPGDTRGNQYRANSAAPGGFEFRTV